jgi:uncharacterized integral membrane protein
MSTVYLIVALVVAIVAVIFALYNPGPVMVSFFTWQITGSLSLVLLVTLAIGVVIGLLVIAPSLVKNTIQGSSQRKRITALEKETAEQKASIASLQAKVEQFLAERATPSPASNPKLPGESGPKTDKLA